MRYVLKRQKFVAANHTGTANTAFTNAALNIRETLKCGPNELAVCYQPYAILSVGGGNADGDDTFSILQKKRSAGGAGATLLLPVWRETIAAASLLNGASFYRHFPGDNSETDLRSVPIILEDQHDLYVTATAGGANVIYGIDFNGVWWIFEEIKEEPGKETTVELPITRAGWWQ